MFAAGDSDTDVSFLQDATILRLTINRNKPELMCNADADADGTWLVNPMFLSPKPQLTAGDACASDACVDAQGQASPCLDELGAPIADQQDRVFCPDGVYCTE